MSYSSEVLADAPLAYWRLGEALGSTTMVDSSGNGHGGTYAAATLAQPGLLFGDADTAAANPRAAVSYAAWMDTAAITLEAVVRPTGVSGLQFILDRDGDAGNPRAYQWRLNGANLELIYWTAAAGPLSVLGATSLAAGTTYHVAATWNGTTARLYVNGVLDGSNTSGTGGLATAAWPITVGAHVNPGGPSQWVGLLDELAVYGTALSAARLFAHYQLASLGTPGALPPFKASLAGSVPVAATYVAQVLSDVPLAYYRMGEASGTTLVDSSGNGHAGTYTPAPTHGTGLLAGDSDTSVDYPTAGVAAVPTGTWMDNTSLTVEALVRPTNVTGYHFVVSREFNGTTGTFWLAVNNGKVDVLLHPGGATSQWQSNGAIAVNTTYHLALTVTPTAASLYINGTLDKTVAMAAALPVATRDLRIGQWEGGLPFTGKIDEVAYYGTALSATRLAAHYTATTSVPAAAGTLAGALPPFGATLAGTSLTPGTTGILAATLPTFTGPLAGTSTPTPPPVTATLAATVAPFAAALQGNTPTAGNKLTAVLPAFTISLQAANRITATDTTYTNDSYTYGGTAQVDYDTPVAPPPPGLVRRDVRRVHQSLPTPTLVRGRPQ